jgi:hypothetical protein
MQQPQPSERAHSPRGRFPRQIGESQWVWDCNDSGLLARGPGDHHVHQLQQPLASQYKHEANYVA